MVGLECAQQGTGVMVDMGDEIVEATVTRMPFIDNRAKVWRGLEDD